MQDTLDDWIARESISFSLDQRELFNSAVDRMIAGLDDAVELLGFGEAMHGSEEMLVLRNRLFERLVESHGYSAIAIESSFPRALIANEYIAGGGAAAYEDIAESGFSHGFGRSAANRELVEWMRAYNADPTRTVKLRFYGFDSPTEMMSTDSPRLLLQFVVNYLTSVDSNLAEGHRERIEPLLGQDADWDNPAAAFDPTKSIGLSPAANALRIETENLISKLCIHRPEFVAKCGAERFLEAMQYAALARQMLNYHAGLAGTSKNRIAELLGMRDVMMADNLAYMVARERCRGKVFAFAHNTHLQRGIAQWQLGADLLRWWPAGSHVDCLFGPRYAVIGSGFGTCEAQGIGSPEAGSLEARAMAVPGPGRLIPTYRSRRFATAEAEGIPTRSSSTTNSTYFPLTARSLSDFDWLAVLG